MICLYFGIPLHEVENLPIDEYRMYQWTIFNVERLRSDPKEFKFMTEDEEVDELDAQIEHYKREGLLK